VQKCLNSQVGVDSKLKKRIKDECVPPWSPYML